MQRICYLLTIIIFITSCTTKQQIDISFDGINDFNFNQVITEANREGKTILFYFSSIACVNCRAMEDAILSNSIVQKSILKDNIFIPLIVDDRNIAERKYWKQSLFSNDTLKLVGELNSEFQIGLTKSGHQPYFAIVSKDKVVLSKVGYTMDKDDFLDFLKK